MPHVKLGKYLRFYKSELLRYIGRTSARFGQQGLRSYDQTRYSTPPCKGKSEAQEKGRCLWFNQVVPTTTASPRRAGVQGSRSFLESITSSQFPPPSRHFQHICILSVSALRPYHAQQGLVQVNSSVSQPQSTGEFLGISECIRDSLLMCSDVH